MSKVDMKVFEEVRQEIGYDDLDHMIYEMCEGDISFDKGYEWETPRPSYQLSKNDPEEYERLMDLYQQERDNEYQEYIDKVEASVGYQHLEQEGGGEGQGEYCYGVFKLKGVIYKASYSYYSYNGHMYDYICETLEEVRPVEKTVIVYE